MGEINMPDKEALMVLHQVTSALLCQPDQVDLKESQIFHPLRESLNRLQIGESKLIENLAGSINQYSVEDLLIEYTRLFLGPFKVLAAPYSSVYLDKDGLLYGNSSLLVKRYYHEAGYELKNDLFELPDHIVIETEFLYTLLFNDIHSPNDQGDSANYFGLYEKFRRNHYNLWVPQFALKIQQNTENHFYMNIARLLELTAKEHHHYQ